MTEEQSWGSVTLFISCSACLRPRALWLLTFFAYLRFFPVLDLGSISQRCFTEMQFVVDQTRSPQSRQCGSEDAESSCQTSCTMQKRPLVIGSQNASSTRLGCLARLGRVHQRVEQQRATIPRRGAMANPFSEVRPATQAVVLSFLKQCGEPVADAELIPAMPLCVAGCTHEWHGRLGRQRAVHCEHAGGNYLMLVLFLPSSLARTVPAAGCRGREAAASARAWRCSRAPKPAGVPRTGPAAAPCCTWTSLERCLQRCREPCGRCIGPTW